jgi:hypothetical protein
LTGGSSSSSGSGTGVIGKITGGIPIIGPIISKLPFGL